MNEDRNELLKRIAQASRSIEFAVLTDQDLHYLAAAMEATVASQEANPMYPAIAQSRAKDRLKVVR